MTLGDPSRFGDDEILVRLDGHVESAGKFAGAVGTVSQVGARAQALLGQRVLLGPTVPCGECDVCRRGGAAVCPGGQRLEATAGTPLRAHARWACVLDGPLATAATASPNAAALAADAAMAFAMYARAGIGPRDATIVIGDDAVARFLLDVLIAKGAPPIVIAGGGVAHRAAALGLQVLPVLDAAVIRASANTLGHRARPYRVFVTTHVEDRWQAALDLAGPRTTVVFRAPGPVTAQHLARALAVEASLIGVAGCHPDLLLEVAALAARGELDLTGATVEHDAADAAIDTSRVRIVTT